MGGGDLWVQTRQQLLVAVSPVRWLVWQRASTFQGNSRDPRSRDTCNLQVYNTSTHRERRQAGRC